MTHKTAASLTAVLIFAGLAGSSLGASSAASAKPRPPKWALHGPYSPKIDPANFVARVTNRYFPLKPGTGFHYRGHKEGTEQVDDMVVTRRTKTILGVKCTVVRDTVSQGGKAVERTFDYYAQDKEGNVWYMGEDSLELRHGKLVRAGDSWQSGVNGAHPGIIMRADPKAGDVYRQEYYPPGGALDQARVLGRRGAMTVPLGTFKHTLVTVEWSPVEPQYEQKVYVAGIGEISERVTQGGNEAFALARVTHG